MNPISFSLKRNSVEWCKVFGSERNNRTYYTKCIEELNVVRQFDKAMIAKYGLDGQETTEEVINAYREDIRRRFSLMVTGKERSIG